jgi:hypothetical protein
MNPGTFQRITIVNTIHTGAGFAVTHAAGDNCYVPAAVLGSSQAGEECDALLVDNPNVDARDRTPYMVRFIRRAAPIEAAPAPAPSPVSNDAVRGTVEAHVRRTMKEGGVWTTLTMFQDYMDSDDATREDDPAVYNAVSAALRKMFKDDECAKWSMWTKASQSKPGREWFSCNPQIVDVAEWE